MFRSFWPPSTVLALCLLSLCAIVPAASDRARADVSPMASDVRVERAPAAATFVTRAQDRVWPRRYDEADPPASRRGDGAHVQRPPLLPSIEPAYLVMSRETYLRMPDLVRGGVPKRDALGADLMLVETPSFRLPAISERIHVRERRCGGYFAFSTRADAEAFLRDDRSALGKRSLMVPLRYTIDNAATVEPWLPQVAHGNIRATIAHLSSYRNRYYAAPTGREAAQWIHDTWLGLAAGRDDVTAELVSCANCSTQPSVVLTIRGSVQPEEIVVLGGHLDSIVVGGGGSLTQYAPGADDDASGIATLTEVLRVAMASGWRPRRTVKFMAYAAEEVGLRGSNAIARAHRAEQKRVIAVLQFDMTNYNASAGVDMRLVTDYSHTGLQNFVLRLFDAYLAPRGMTRGTSTCGYACSDHASWTAAGYPSAYMFEAGTAGGGYFPHIHTGNDTLANMGDSAQHSAKFAMLGLAFLGEAAKTTGP